MVHDVSFIFNLSLGHSLCIPGLKEKKMISCIIFCQNECVLQSWVYIVEGKEIRTKMSFIYFLFASLI